MKTIQIHFFSNKTFILVVIFFLLPYDKHYKVMASDIRQILCMFSQHINTKYDKMIRKEGNETKLLHIIIEYYRKISRARVEREDITFLIFASNFIYIHACSSWYLLIENTFVDEQIILFNYFSFWLAFLHWFETDYPEKMSFFLNRTEFHSVENQFIFPTKIWIF